MQTFQTSYSTKLLLQTSKTYYVFCCNLKIFIISY